MRKVNRSSKQILSNKTSPLKTKKPFEPVRSRERLLRAALEVFSKNGYHGTTTKMISVAAGANEALISRHFETKLGLFMEVVRQNLFDGFAELPYPPQESLSDELVLFAEFIFENDLKKIDFLKILVSQSLQDKEFAAQMRTQVASRASSLLLERLKLLQKRNKLSLKTDISAVEHVVRNQIFSAIFFSGMCRLFDHKEGKNILRFTLSNFAKGLDR